MEKKFVLSLALICLPAARLQADVALGTSNSPGTPLTMSADSTSGPMFLTVSSDNYPNDLMAAWNVDLQIAPIARASGTLTFEDPATGSPPNPPNYVFGTEGLGIVDINSGTSLTANDFYNPTLLATVVPGTTGANLLQMDFQASSNASGLFGIYAEEGAANTQWTDNNYNTQFFSNVPDGSGKVLIGEVSVTAARLSAGPRAVDAITSRVGQYHVG